MRIYETKTKELFHMNPAGETFINIYYGCDLVCPFCYWQVDQDWAEKITVYTDVAERLAEVIETIPQRSRFGLGYKGNAYTSIERDYGLTRRVLELLIDHRMEITLSASRGNDIILRDLDLLTRSDAYVKVIMEMTRLDIVKEFNQKGSHLAFDVANTLKSNGVDICTTISPVMPGITDVERMAAALPDIPVHISSLEV